MQLQLQEASSQRVSRRHHESKVKTYIVVYSSVVVLIKASSPQDTTNVPIWVLRPTSDGNCANFKELPLYLESDNTHIVNIKMKYQIFLIQYISLNLISYCFLH